MAIVILLFDRSSVKTQASSETLNTENTSSCKKYLMVCIDLVSVFSEMALFVWLFDGF